MQAHLNRKIARPAPNGASPRFGDTPHHSGPDVHRVLAGFNTRRLRPGSAGPEWRDQIALEATMRTLEAEFIERERAAEGDPLFPYLAERADREEMRWFLAQEVAGEAGFDDLVAMTQVGFPVEAKLELARNYWDEMGRGNRKGMHGPMLQTLARALDVVPTPETTVWEALALNNLMVGLATNRRYAFQSIGALGVIELTAPGRSVQVNAGLKRLGVPSKARHYFELHAVLDVKHSESWNREILRSLVAAQPQSAVPIAEGALLRLTAGARCFNRYRSQFGLAAPPLQ